MRERAAGWPPDHEPAPEELAQALGGSPDDWVRLREAWGERFDERLRLIAERRMNLRVRMLGGTQVGYARMTRRWWTPVHDRLAEQGLNDRPIYLVSSNTHSLVNIVTGVAREREQALIEFVETLPEDDILRQELAAFREGRTEGSWENFLYFVARLYFDSHGEEGRLARRRSEQEAGVSHLPSRTALRVPAQIIPLAQLDPAGLDSRLGEVDPEALAHSEAVVVNIDYPLGLGAYNILREVAVSSAGAARRLRAGQGGDAERRRRRRDDLERRPRRALGLDLLARQRLLASTTWRAICASAAASTTSARSR